MRAVHQGSAPDGAEFVQQAPEPFQSHSARPARRCHHLAAMKLEGETVSGTLFGSEPAERAEQKA